jgi:hypothetical protein
MISPAGTSFQTTLHLTATFYAGQLAAGEILDQLSSGEISKKDTHLFKQSTHVETQLKTAQHVEQSLEQDVEMMHAMADAVKKADALFDQIISLLKTAEADGTISTERIEIQNQIRALRGEIYRTLEKTEHLGENILKLEFTGVQYAGASLSSAIGLVDKFTDSRLTSIYTTLDALILDSQDTAEEALLTVQDLQKNTFGTMRQAVLGFSDAMDIELAQNKAYQLSLMNRLNALQGVSIPELMSELSDKQFQNDTIISAILSSEKVSQQLLHLFKYTPIEMIDRLSVTAHPYTPLRVAQG